jgi:membrane protein
MLETPDRKGATPRYSLSERLDRRPVVAAAKGFLRHGGLTSSAALAFYFLMSLFPFLIFLASALALLPIPHLATRMVELVAHFIPRETMPMIESMLTSTMHASHGLLSAGFVLSVISASNAFAAMSTFLSIIFESEQQYGFWRSRWKAISMTFVIGGMTTIAFSAMLLGPHFGRELARVFHVNETLVWLWPTLRYVLAIGGALASVEMLYYLASTRKTLWEQLAGSVFAVVVWIASSAVLGIYLREFSYLNAMYGTLASFIVLMIWLQITAAAILLGAELNMALEKAGAASGVRAPKINED